MSKLDSVAFRRRDGSIAAVSVAGPTCGAEGAARFSDFNNDALIPTSLRCSSGVISNK